MSGVFSYVRRLLSNPPKSAVYCLFGGLLAGYIFSSMSENRIYYDEVRRDATNLLHEPGLRLMFAVSLFLSFVAALVGLFQEKADYFWPFIVVTCCKGTYELIDGLYHIVSNPFYFKGVEFLSNIFDIVVFIVPALLFLYAAYIANVLRTEWSKRGHHGKRGRKAANHAHNSTNSKTPRRGSKSDKDE